LAEEHGDRREAENQLIDALRLDPNNTRALVALGQLRESAGDPAQAVSNYTRALAINPAQPALSARVAALQSGQAGAVRTAALPPSAGVQPGPSTAGVTGDSSWGPGR
jgi:cytochrome c-type biogenesis protein CcmH/NrfG